MRKFLWFHDEDHPADCAELSPLTLDEFTRIGRWSGMNDIAFNQFLRHNHFFEIDRFSEETLRSSTIELVLGEPSIDCSITYGDHDDQRCPTCNVLGYKNCMVVSEQDKPTWPDFDVTLAFGAITLMDVAREELQAKFQQAISQARAEGAKEEREACAALCRQLKTEPFWGDIGQAERAIMDRGAK